MQEFDSELGWRHIPGAYVLMPYSPSGSPIRVTFNDDGGRVTSNRPASETSQKPRIIFVGCSYLEGWAISDEETMAWKIAAALPRYSVLNYGTVGYSTYQSLLLLRRLRENIHPGDIVAYGFITDHLTRNMGRTAWRRALDNPADRRQPAVPYVSESNGRLVEHKPRAYPNWPSHGSSALISLAETFYADRFDESEGGNAAFVLNELIQDMQSLTSQRAGRFVVIDMSFTRGDPTQVASWIPKARSIVDCRQQRSPELVVEGEVHPNGLANDRYASCVVNALVLQMSERASKNGS